MREEELEGEAFDEAGDEAPRVLDDGRLDEPAKLVDGLPDGEDDLGWDAAEDDEEAAADGNDDEGDDEGIAGDDDDEDEDDEPIVDRDSRVYKTAQGATEGLNDLYRDGAAVAREMKDTFDELKSMLSFKDLFGGK